MCVAMATLGTHTVNYLLTKCTLSENITVYLKQPTNTIIITAPTHGRLVVNTEKLNIINDAS